MKKARVVRSFQNVTMHWSCVFRRMKGLQIIWKVPAGLPIYSKIPLPVQGTAVRHTESAVTPCWLANRHLSTV